MLLKIRCEWAAKSKHTMETDTVAASRTMKRERKGDGANREDGPVSSALKATIQQNKQKLCAAIVCLRHTENIHNFVVFFMFLSTALFALSSSVCVCSVSF